MIKCLAAACLLGVAAGANAEEFPYELRYDVTLQPEEGRAEVSVTFGEGAQNIRWIRFTIDWERMGGFEADGELERHGKHLTWTPPADGGRLTFTVRIDRRRGERFDARVTEDWAIFRGDNLVPPARVRQEKGAEAEAELHVHVPEGWSFVAPYEELREHVYHIENPERGFDRPTGWMAAGRLGVRREWIAGVSVAVAGPVNHGLRRLDMLAFLNWTLPELRAIVDELPERLLVVSAHDDMWRGGLSGPRSLYLHADLPLISTDGSSTLLHELIHVATRLRGRDGGDWIVEGIAEYYSLKFMWRSGTLTRRRYQAAFRQLSKRAGDLEFADLATERASGRVTARAVLLLRELDHEIHRETGKEKSLDDVVKRLVGAREPVTLERLRDAVEAVMGEPAGALANGGKA